MGVISRMKRLLLISAAIAIAIFPAHSIAAGPSPAPPPLSDDDDPELQPPGPQDGGDWVEPQGPPKSEDRG